MPWRPIPILLLFWAVASVQAQESQVLEEVTVRAPRPLGILRAEIAVAEQALYDAFNKILTERDYQIECRRYTPTGSRVSRRVCEPAYIRMLQSEATWRGLFLADFDAGNLDIATLRVAGNASSEIAREDRALLDKMVVAVNENPEVMRALIDYMQKKQAVTVALEGNARSGD